MKLETIKVSYMVRQLIIDYQKTIMITAGMTMPWFLMNCSTNSSRKVILCDIEALKETQRHCYAISSYYYFIDELIGGSKSLEM